MEFWNHNSSSITHFIIAGIPGIQDWKERIALAAVFFVIYTITVTENLIVIIVIITDSALHSSMYLIICNLAFLDLLIPSVTIPEMVYYLVTDERSIAFVPCILQMYCYVSFLITELLIIASMAYDRYQAICNPLHYHTVMTTKHTFMLSALCWAGGTIKTMVHLYFVLIATYCGPNKIDYFCCNYAPIILLACSEVYTHNEYTVVFSFIIIAVALTFILFSYVKIIASVLRTGSAKGHTKAFSTCGSHLLVISIFLVVISFLLISYAVEGISEQIRTLSAIVQNLVPPLINPIIYCLKTKEIRTSVTKMLKKFRLWVSL
ncbi:olfactory receptor 6B1-like [Protopterus annectens]|uniref:olfactory receptor 6B1-like n=1 Tax=Protopterus annectens TaxID=7888 RepID=UPI001CFB4B74|nr:olfactory receptor 6B1-like [Protopterus annectens]